MLRRDSAVIMPPSALDRLTRLNIHYPMLFQIKNPSTERATHCGVLEFIADEGFIHMPSRLMAHLGIQEEQVVLVTNTRLPTATFVKLRPHTKDFLDVSHHKELLEYNIRKKFQCLTAGETIAITEGDRRFHLDLLETRPADAVCTLETDCEVDFAPPLDYVEPPRAAPAPAPAPVTAAQGSGEPPLFTGFAARVDGKPVEQPPPAPVHADGRHGDQPRHQFTGVAMRMDGKPAELPSPPKPAHAGVRHGDQPRHQFTGVAMRMDGKPVELPSPPKPAPKRKFRSHKPAAAVSGVSQGKEGGATGKEEEKRFTGTPYSLKD
jgi:ubiquitin fusion degradation protein 1